MTHIHILHCRQNFWSISTWPSWPGQLSGQSWWNATDTVTPWLCHKTGVNYDSIRTFDRLIGAIIFSAASKISKFEMQWCWILEDSCYHKFLSLKCNQFFFSAFIGFINERKHKSCYRNVDIKCIVDTLSDSISLPVYLATKIFVKQDIKNLT